MENCIMYFANSIFVHMRPKQTELCELGVSMLQTGCEHYMVVLDPTISTCTEIFAEESSYVTALHSSYRLQHS